MNALWGKTLQLWRGYPILWLPVLLADTLRYLLTMTKTSALQGLIHWIISAFLVHHSVLGGTDNTLPSPEVMLRLKYWVAVPGSFVFSWAQASVYVLAAIVTARMVFNLLAAEDALRPCELKPLSRYVSGIWWIGLLSTVLGLAVGGAIGSLLLVLEVIGRPTTPWFTNQLLSGLAVFPAYLALAYFVTPMFLRYVCVFGEEEISSVTISEGRVAGAVAAVAVVALSITINLVRFPVVQASGEQALLGLFGSLFVALAYIPLFIALGVLASRRREPTPMAD